MKKCVVQEESVICQQQGKNNKLNIILFRQPQSMQYLAAATLATLGGKEVNEQSLTAILSSTGKPVDAAQVKAVVDSLKGKQVHELITKGQSKVGSVGGGSAGAAPKKEEKKVEKKEEPKKKEQPKKQEKKAEEQEENFNLDLFG